MKCGCVIEETNKHLCYFQLVCVHKRRASDQRLKFLSYSRPFSIEAVWLSRGRSYNVGHALQFRYHGIRLHNWNSRNSTIESYTTFKEISSPLHWVFLPKSTKHYSSSFHWSVVIYRIIIERDRFRPPRNSQLYSVQISVQKITCYNSFTRSIFSHSIHRRSILFDWKVNVSWALSIFSPWLFRFLSFFLTMSIRPSLTWYLYRHHR